MPDLSAVLRGQNPEARLLIVAAHPDDEVIGVGCRLRYLSNVTLVHVTDGSPRSLYDATRYGFPNAESYARQRRCELSNALREAGASPKLIELGFADQSTTHELSHVTLALVSLLEDQKPEVVLTHPYEGGHPDHDATAFAVSAAAQLSARSDLLVAEFTSYHAHNGQFRSGQFLPNRGPELRFDLTHEEQQRKRRMLACFETQREVLAPFGVDAERFRKAPHYDFTQPPHAGQLWYEQFDWGTDGLTFRSKAARAAEELDLRTVGV